MDYKEVLEKVNAIERAIGGLKPFLEEKIQEENAERADKILRNNGVSKRGHLQGVAEMFAELLKDIDLDEIDWKRNREATKKISNGSVISDNFPVSTTLSDRSHDKVTIMKINAQKEGEGISFYLQHEPSGSELKLYNAHKSSGKRLVFRTDEYEVRESEFFSKIFPKSKDYTAETIFKDDFKLMVCEKEGADREELSVDTLSFV